MTDKMQDVCESRGKQPGMLCQTSHRKHLIIAVRNNNTVPSENLTHPKELKKQDNEERLNN